MTRPAIWKVLTVSAAVTGLGIVGAGAAIADPGMTAQASPAMVATASANVNAPSATLDSDLQHRMNKGGVSSQSQTRGSTQIYTAPNPTVGAKGGVYGPFFSQNRGLGGAGGGR